MGDDERARLASSGFCLRIWIEGTIQSSIGAVIARFGVTWDQLRGRAAYIYAERNRQFIPNYGERYRNGERIAPGLVESAVNQLVSKRMLKREQMEPS
jgi:hypothetical protein